MNVIRQVLKTGLAAVLPSDRFMIRGPGHRTGCTEQGRVDQQTSETRIALTFDDGPHPEHTPRLLDYLAATGIRATFFVVGENARRNRSVVRRIVEDGHELGNHTFTHSEPNCVSSRQFLAEVRQTRALLQDVTGGDCRLVRPPKGKLSVGKLWYLLKEEQTVVLWNVDPRDYAMQTHREMERWCAVFQPTDGDIVLMHDDRPHASTAIPLLSSHSDFTQLRFVRISDWLTEITSTIPQNESETERRIQCLHSLS